MNNLYGTLSSEPTALELKNRELSRVAAREGFVLLKNDNNALPLKNKRIALYGMGARLTVKGGLGSGSVEERYSVNIEDGLKNAGFEITTGKWLDDYDSEYTSTYKEYHDMVEEKVKDLVNPMEIIPIAHSYVYRYPSGRLVTKEDIEKSNTDTVIYVLMRQAGESNDRKLENGDYYITDIERENLRIVSEAYENTILVINVGGHIDLSFLDEIKGIDAVVLFVQGGEEGGNALSDVLSGKVNFSGKLSDTIPLCYEDIPFGAEFSYLNGDLKNEYYKEGIYVGYRYFDSFNKEVRYPFGFGLSYTDFKIETKSVSLDKTNINIKVAVTNIGEVSGKEVVQVYVSLPGKDKEYQRLVSFQKTKELEKGELETLDLSFSLEDCTSYNEEKAAWLLYEGDYILRVGNSSRNTNLSAILEVPQTVVVTECKNCCSLQDELPLFYPDTEREERVECDIRLKVNPADFTTRTIAYNEPSIIETEEEKAILDSLRIEEEAWLLQ